MVKRSGGGAGVRESEAVILDGICTPANGKWCCSALGEVCPKRMANGNVVD